MKCSTILLKTIPLTIILSTAIGITDSRLVAINNKNIAIALTIVSLLVTWDYCRTPPRKEIPICTSKNPFVQFYHFYQWNIRGHGGTKDRIEQKIRVKENVYEYRYAKVKPRGIGLLVENYKAIMLALTVPIAIQTCMENVQKYRYIWEIICNKCVARH